MKIAFLSPFPPLPIFHGAVRRIWGLAAQLVKTGNEIVIISKSIKSGYMVHEGVEIFNCPNPHFFPQAFGKLGTTSMVKSLISLRGEVDIVQCEFPYMFPLSSIIKLFGKPLVLDEHGVEAVHSQSISFNRAIPRAKLWFIYLLEKLAIENSNLVFACSKIDAEEICELYQTPLSKVQVIPNAVENAFFEKVQAFEYSKPTIMFLGGVDHPPNKYAIELLFKKIVPFVTSKVKDAQFSFVGKIYGYSSVSSKKVILHGQVGDVRPFIHGADICVAPIYHGTGTRLKILEYMACGKPVVATSKAVEGLEGIKDGENVIIKDEVENFSRALVELLEDAPKRMIIGRAGFKLVRQRYNWQDVAEKAMDCYRSIV